MIHGAVFSKEAPLAAGGKKVISWQMRSPKRLRCRVGVKVLRLDSEENLIGIPPRF
jgi:hypothetical protein